MYTNHGEPEPEDINSNGEANVASQELLEF